MSTTPDGLTPDQQIIAKAIEVIISVSPANMARRDELLCRTLVNPYALRDLADAIEDAYPGAIADSRAGGD